MRAVTIFGMATSFFYVISANPTHAQATATQTQLRADLARALALIEAQQARLNAQESRINSLEQSLTQSRTAAPAQAAAASPTNGASRPQGIEPVGVAPEDYERAPEVAVLGERGTVVTRPGQLTAEFQLDYARADRNRAIFRGIEVIESVLVGVFDINESRQDVLTGAAAFRYGLFRNFEVGVKVPYIYRSDKSVLAPIQGSTGNDAAATIDNSANGNGIGDIEFTARYQFRSAHNGWPFLIGNLQVIAPTGKDPFAIDRDSLGRPAKAATGAGFWGVSPSVTAILPTDPAVLFATVGYTKNFGHDVDTIIPPVMITRVKPGDAIALSAGIGVALNDRTSFNLGYAHSWVFGTKTTTRLLQESNTWSDEITTRARDLQLGRFLFGVTYRLNELTSLNWAVEVGATEDATDLRTTLRIPFVLLSGRP